MVKNNTCKKGFILRNKYTRKSYKTKNGKTIKKTIVQASCIKDRGLPGKGKKLFTLKKGELGKFGYKLSKKAEERRKSLKNSNKCIDKNTLIKKLNALSILQKNTNPVNSRKAKYDMRWVQKNL